MVCIDRRAQKEEIRVLGEKERREGREGRRESVYKTNVHHHLGLLRLSPGLYCLHLSPGVSLTKETPPLTSCVASSFVDLSQADFSARRLDFFSFFSLFPFLFFLKSRSSSKLKKDYF